MIAPKLRFREFEAPWVEYPLGDLANLSRGKFSIRPRNDPKYFGGDIPFIQTGDVVKSGIYVEKYTQTLNKLGESVSKIFPSGTIMITIAANIGDLAILKYPMACPDSLVGIEVKSNISNNLWLMYSLSLKKDELDANATQNAQKNINLQVLNALNIFSPSYIEQTKIADFLSSVDEKIALQTKQYELLCHYKKGVMQRIFSQELRFKDENGEAFAEWESKLFTNIYKFISTNSLSRSELNYQNGSIKNIHYGDIHTKLSVNFDVKKENIPFIIKSIKVPDEQYCKENDLIIADASEDYKDVGKCIEIIATNDEKIVAGLHTFLARPQIDVARGFGGYMMQSEIVRKPIKIMATGVSVLSISKKNLSNLQLKMPCKQEQTKIADFLTAIDDKITAAKKQLEQLKQWKQGLLQQMFI